MKRTLFILLTFGAAFVSEAKPDKYQQLATVAGRARCISRELKDGLVIETWKRGNFMWANTNVQKRVISARQTNTFEDKLAKLRNDVSELVAVNTNLSAVVVSVKVKIKAAKNKMKEKKDKYKKNGNNGNGNNKKVYEEITADIEEFLAILDEIDGGDE